jgi:hypothetical protein
MRLNEFIEGVHILRQYMNDQNGFHLGADHDIIYFYATDNPVSEVHLGRLKELGWFQPDVRPDVKGVEEYSPRDGWAAYV